jgi:hypothetical protein
MSADARYIAHLRQIAKELSPMWTVSCYIAYLDQRAKDVSSINRHHITGPKRHWDIPGTLDGVSVAAFPDSGSSRDFVSHYFVKTHLAAHNIDSTSSSSIKLPNGNIIRTIGNIKLPFQCEGESVAYVRTFAVLASCVHDVVLGKPFLRATETLTKFRHRLKEKWVRYLEARGLHVMGHTNEEFLGQMDGYLTSACPDTGSDIMAMSSQFAKQRGYCLDESSAAKIQVQFADGSIVWTKGRVDNVHWQFGYGKGTNSYKLSFYVLEELPCSVMLGKEFLFDNDIFRKFEKYFIRFDDDENSDDGDGLYLIQKVVKSSVKTVRDFFRSDVPFSMFPWIFVILKLANHLEDDGAVCFPPRGREGGGRNGSTSTSG